LYSFSLPLSFYISPNPLSPGSLLCVLSFSHSLFPCTHIPAGAGPTPPRPPSVREKAKKNGYVKKEDTIFLTFGGEQKSKNKLCKRSVKDLETKLKIKSHKYEKKTTRQVLNEIELN